MPTKLSYEVVPFKETPQVHLKMHVFKPEQKASAAIVFFVCGGWNGFDLDKYHMQSAYFQSRGILCAIAEVRVMELHGTTPRECVIDAKSAIRFVRAHADEWAFPADKLVASGGSAAGHVSLSTDIIDGFEDETDDQSVSSKPNLICAYNPAVLPPLDLSTSPQERIDARIEKFGSEEQLMALSPCEHVREGIIPVLLLHGDADEVTPLADTEYFQQNMLAMGNDTTLHIYPKAGHGFFNYTKAGNPYFFETTKHFDQWLIKQGFVSDGECVDQFNFAEYD